MRNVFLIILITKCIFLTNHPNSGINCNAETFLASKNSILHKYDIGFLERPTSIDTQQLIIMTTFEWQIRCHQHQDQFDAFNVISSNHFINWCLFPTSLRPNLHGQCQLIIVYLIAHIFQYVHLILL